jgi:ribose transport system substrate-binding protein
MCDKFKEMGIEDEAQVVQITGQPGYTTAIERSQGLRGPSARSLPECDVVETQPGDWNREKSRR